MSENIHNDLIFVGYTNGAQVLYANDNKYGAQGAFYKTTEHDCLIPLYMLKTHENRIKDKRGDVTLDMIKTAQDA